MFIRSVNRESPEPEHHLPLQSLPEDAQTNRRAFGEAKELMGFRRAKFRYRTFVREQVLMTAAAQNIKRMVKLLSRRAPMREAGVDRASLLHLRESLTNGTLMVVKWLRAGWGFSKVTLEWNEFFNSLSRADP